MSLRRLPGLLSAFMLTLVIALPAWANSRAVKAFPWSSETFHNTLKSSNYRVFLSPINQINGELRADDSVRLSVKGEVIGTLIRDGYGPDRVMEFYRSQLKALGARILFFCDGQDCGSSSLWANQVFGHSDYFAPDTQQHYMAAEWEDPEGNHHLGLFYVVRRGDQKVRGLRLLLEMEKGKTIRGPIPEQGRRLGPVIIHWEPGIAIKLETDAESIRHIQQLIDQNPKADFVISSFSELTDKPVGQQIDLARRAGEVAARQLQRWGVDQDRLHVIPVGPGILMPSSSQRHGNRVEIEVIRQRGSGS